MTEDADHHLNALREIWGAQLRRVDDVTQIHLRNISRHIDDLRAGHAELKRLLLENSEQLRAHNAELRELRARLNGRDA